MTAVAIYAIQHEYTISPRDYRYHTGKFFWNKMKNSMIKINDYEYDLQPKKCNHSKGTLTVMLPIEDPLIPPKNPDIGLTPTCTL